MELKLIDKPNATVLELSGKLLDGPFMQELNNTLHKILDEGKRNVIVDASRVFMITSTGIGTLISGYTTMKNGNGNFVLANITDRAKNLLSVTRLDCIFEYFPTVDEAVVRFNK